MMIVVSEEELSSARRQLCTNNHSTAACLVTRRGTATYLEGCGRGQLDRQITFLTRDTRSSHQLTKMSASERRIRTDLLHAP